MKFYWILFIVVLLINLNVPCKGDNSSISLQDYVDSFLKSATFRTYGVKSLDESVNTKIWPFFKAKYARAYSSSGDENQRRNVFRNHLQYVVKSNLDQSRTYRLELNQFSDWTLDEFNQYKKGLIVPNNLRRNLIDEQQDDDYLQNSLRKLYKNQYGFRRTKRSLLKRRYKDKRIFEWFWNLFNNNNTQTPDSSNKPDGVDWRTKNVLSGIKNQLKCGSCYAFATATVLESLYALKTKSQIVTEFSPQQITDCSYGINKGCNGGNFPQSVRYLNGKGGKIATDASYPYVAKVQSCRTSGLNEISLGNIEYGSITVGDEKRLAEAVANYGPIFIGIDTDTEPFMFYKTGVLKINNCPNQPSDMDHAVVVVGYGYDKSYQMPYWIIKNSWGTTWGENGYLRLAKDSGNMCGVASMAFYGKLT